MPGRAKIAIDLDDVLAANAEGFVAYSNERWGTHLTVEDYSEHWAQLWETDHEETMKRATEYVSSRSMSNYRHYPEAVLVLRRLARTYDLVILTSRRSVIRSETAAWLERNFKGIFMDVHHAGIFDRTDPARIIATKAEMTAEIGADYLVDDQLKHCLAVAEMGVPAVLFGDYNWNQADSLPERVTRCRDWDEVEAYFGKRAS